VSSRATAPQYQLSGSTDLGGEFCRIGLAELRFARAEAAFAAADADALHQCRKSIKRLRALSRLASAAGDRDSKELERELGRIGRRLSEARDAEVLSRVAASLHEAAAAPGKRRPRLLDARPDRHLVAAVVAELGALEPELERFLSDVAVTGADLERSLAESFRTAGKRMRRFMQHGRPEAAHDWRKIVQRLHNQLRLVAGVVPSSTRMRLASLDELAGQLGDYQDLSVLQSALVTGLVRCKPGTRSKLRRAARARKRELERTSLKLGRRLFVLPEPAADREPGAIADSSALAVAR